MTSARPLAGVRVLDLASLFPAPLLAALLGDLGADVVTVEPPEGDPLRRVGATRDGIAVAWRVAGRNKRSVVVADDVALQLADVADVVVVNQPVRVLERRGWDHATLMARNPRLVHVTLSAFGATGPYADRPGNGTIAEAFGGFAHLNGAADGPPVLPSLALGDSLAATTAVAPVLAALYARDVRGAGGARLDLTMYEPILGLLASTIAAWDPSEVPPARLGSRLASATPRNVYRCADDRWVAVSAPTDDQVAKVLTIIGRADEVARWGRAAQRVGAEADALDAAVAAWIATQSRDAVLAALLVERLPAAPVSTLADLAADPHVAARGSLDTAVGGAHPAVPDVGEHTAAVLAEWLG